MPHKLKIKDLPASERPYEKCLSYGASQLSDAELLAVIIKCGTPELRCTELAELILNQCEQKGGLCAIHQLTHQELIQIPGIGHIKAVQIECAAELAKRISRTRRDPKLKFESAQQISAYYMETLRHCHQEHMILMMLDTKNCLIRESTLSIGTVNYTIMHPREIFIQALKAEAVHIILVHNHPSGDPTPSSEDIHMTRVISELGQSIGIPLLDHIIIGDHCFESLAQYIDEID